MMKSTNLIFIHGLFCLSLMLLSSCSNSQIATSEFNTPSPPSTPSIAPSPSTTPTTSINPTASVTPTEKSLVSYPSHFNLPKWMSDPQAMILANRITERNGVEIISANMAFLNALTREQYNIPFPSNAKAYFWHDNMHFGFLSDDFQMMYLLDLSNGQVIQKNLPIKSTRLLSTNNSHIPLVIKQDPLSPFNSMFDYAFTYWGSPYSIDTKYFAESDRSINENPITVTDSETKQIIWKSEPSDGYWDIHFLWSPVRSSYLAIIAGRLSNTGLEFPVNDTTLTIIDVEKGKTISSYKVDAGRIQWSPDGTKLLYRNAISDYWNFGISFTEAPCFFNLEAGKESCIGRIPNHPPPDGYTLITTDDYQWSSDGKSLYFTYSYNSPNGMFGEICIYDLVSGNFTCPTDDLSRLPGWNIDWPYGWRIASYSLSPDGRNIHFCLDSNHPLSDDQGGPSQDGLIEVNGTNLFTWVSEQEKSGQYSTTRCSFYSALWRPLS